MLAGVSERYPGVFSPSAIDGWVATLNAQLTELGASALQGLVTQVPNVFALVIYLILLPITVFFFLKDRDRLIARVLSVLPSQRPLLDRVGQEMNVADRQLHSRQIPGDSDRRAGELRRVRRSSA